MTAIERGNGAALPPRILGDWDQFGKHLDGGPDRSGPYAP
jgi:hypothetical protein